MRCRDKRWDRQIDTKKPEPSEKALDNELQQKLKAMEEERKKQDAQWTSSKTPSKD